MDNSHSLKISVVVTHVVLSADDPTQYFAIPEKYETLPKKAILVAIGNTEKCWIEVYPVDPSDLEGVTDFKDDIEVTVDIENSFLTPAWGFSNYLQLKKCRWFSELSE